MSSQSTKGNENVNKNHKDKNIYLIHHLTFSNF